MAAARKRPFPPNGRVDADCRRLFLREPPACKRSQATILEGGTLCSRSQATISSGRAARRRLQTPSYSRNPPLQSAATSFSRRKGRLQPAASDPSPRNSPKVLCHHHLFTRETWKKFGCKVHFPQETPLVNRRNLPFPTKKPVPAGCDASYVDAIQPRNLHLNRLHRCSHAERVFAGFSLLPVLGSPPHS